MRRYDILKLRPQRLNEIIWNSPYLCELINNDRANILYLAGVSVLKIQIFEIMPRLRTICARDIVIGFNTSFNQAEELIKWFRNAGILYYAEYATWNANEKTKGARKKYYYKNFFEGLKEEIQRLKENCKNTVDNVKDLNTIVVSNGKKTRNRKATPRVYKIGRRLEAYKQLKSKIDEKKE